MLMKPVTIEEVREQFPAPVSFVVPPPVMHDIEQAAAQVEAERDEPVFGKHLQRAPKAKPVEWWKRGWREKLKQRMG